MGRRPLLVVRRTGFLGQEGHTAHATAEEALAETLRMLDIYADFAENDAAIPVIKGRKSESEKFAGAVTSYTIEAMMGNRWALQAGTSHFLGQNFARAFDIKYLDQNNELQYCWTTSWGVSTRMVGASMRVHGDDQGRSRPARLAPSQVVIVPIWKSAEERGRVLAAAEEVRARLGGLRCKLDAREEYTPGWKFNYWETKGVPLRVEIGPRDVAEGQVVLARRDTGQKLAVPQQGLAERVSGFLDEIQRNLFRRAKKFLDDNSYHLDDYEEFKRIIGEDGGFIYTHWCGSADCEARIKEETKATIRCLPLDQPGTKGRCIYCGKEADQIALFARAY